MKIITWAAEKWLVWKLSFHAEYIGYLTFLQKVKREALKLGYLRCSVHLFNGKVLLTLLQKANNIQVNLCQKHLFLHQLTHNTMTDCSLNYEFSTWNLQGQNMLCTQIVCFFVFVLTFRTILVHNMFSTCSELGIFMYWTRNSMNNLSSYCGLVDARISASDKYLPVLSNLYTV